MKTLHKGLVIKSTGKECVLLTSDNKTITAIIRGKFRLQGIKSTSVVVVGDWVEYYNSDNLAVINSILDRKNYIIRKSVNLSKQSHIIAANIDQAILVVSVKSPLTPTAFIDRFLVSAESFKIPTIIVFNKMDLLNDLEKLEFQKTINTYQTIGYKTISISATANENMDKLWGLVQGKTNLLSGNSGVGKSTIINILKPNTNIKTAQISQQNKGKHTTTFAQMHSIKDGGYLIDSPGIKGFGLIDIEKNDIGNYFPEFFRLKPHCKYYNCIHQNEPNCKVKQELEIGNISDSRYENYLNLLNDDLSNHR